MMLPGKEKKKSAQSETLFVTLELKRKREKNKVS